MNDSPQTKKADRYRLILTQQPIHVRRREVSGKLSGYEVNIEGSRVWKPATVRCDTKTGLITTITMVLPGHTEAHDFSVEVY